MDCRCSSISYQSNRAYEFYDDDNLHFQCIKSDYGELAFDTDEPLEPKTFTFKETFDIIYVALTKYMARDNEITPTSGKKTYEDFNGQIISE